jgi:hypothetical protein
MEAGLMAKDKWASQPGRVSKKTGPINEMAVL